MRGRLKTSLVQSINARLTLVVTKNIPWEWSITGKMIFKDILVNHGDNWRSKLRQCWMGKLMEAKENCNRTQWNLKDSMGHKCDSS
jgi:hypothetical protein